MKDHHCRESKIESCLKLVLDKGLIFKPIDTELLRIDICVDAAFAFGWGTELGSNPDSVKSRTGYIIEIANCPVVWIFKLQSIVAASTM